MAIGSSIFLIAVGAILTFAIEATVAGINIDTVGIILMVAGVIGLAVSLYWADRLGASDHRVVEERHETHSHA